MLVQAPGFRRPPSQIKQRFVKVLGRRNPGAWTSTIPLARVLSSSYPRRFTVAALPTAGRQRFGTEEKEKKLEKKHRNQKN